MLWKHIEIIKCLGCWTGWKRRAKLRIDVSCLFVVVFFARKKTNETKATQEEIESKGKKIEVSCNIYLAQRQMHSTPLSHSTEESILAHALRISRLNASNYALLRDQMCSTPCTRRLSATMQLNCNCCCFDCKRHATPCHATTNEWE